MDPGSLFGGLAPAGPQPAATAGTASGAAAAPEAAGGAGFGSLVDLALEQLAGGSDAPAEAQSSAPHSAPVAEDAETADRAGDEPLDAPIDALGLSVLIALATPVAAPQAEVPMTPPPAAGAGEETGAAFAAVADRPVALPMPVQADTAIAQAAAPVPADGTFEAALDAIAAEDPAAAPAAIETPAGDRAGVAPGRDASETPAPATAPGPARGVSARPGAPRAVKPGIAAIAPALASTGSAPDTVAGLAAQAQGATPASAAVPVASAGPDTAGRAESPLRGPANVTAPIPIEPRQAVANGATGFGDASGDTSTGERFVPALSTGRAAPAAARGLEVIPGGGEGAASIEVAAPLGLAPAVPGASVLRAIDAPLPAARFEQTLAAVDPDTRNLQAMVRTVRLFTAGDGSGEARLQLEPDHLGPVALTVRVEQGSVSAHFRAETPAAQRWIETHQQELRAGLRDQGLEVKEVVVTTDPDGRRERQPDAQPRRPRARRDQADAPRFEVVV